MRVFEVRFLRKIFGLEREQFNGDWKKLHKEEPHDLQVYISHQTMLGRSNRRGCGARYVGSLGNKRNEYTVLVGNLKERNHLEYLGVSGKVILNCTLNKWDRMT